MTHLLPPNLLKLFAPRPPLPYMRPVDRDFERVKKKQVSGLVDILARVREENAMGTGVGKRANGEDVTMEEGEEVEEPFTLAEEYRRQVRREERQKLKEEQFQKAKSSCACLVWLSVRFLFADPCPPRQAVRRPRGRRRPVQDTIHCQTSACDPACPVLHTLTSV